MGTRIIEEQRTRVAGKIYPVGTDAAKRTTTVLQQEVQYQRNRGEIGLALGEAADGICGGLAVLMLNTGDSNTGGNIRQMDH